MKFSWILGPLAPQVLGSAKLVGQSAAEMSGQREGEQLGRYWTYRWTGGRTSRFSPEEDEGVLKEDSQAGTNLLLCTEEANKKKTVSKAVCGVWRVKRRRGGGGFYSLGTT